MEFKYFISFLQETIFHVDYVTLKLKFGRALNKAYSLVYVVRIWDFILE